MSKVVIAEYKNTDVFKIPKGLDLQDKEQVKSWYVKWGSLRITKTDGTELKINSEDWCGNDYKYPDYTAIVDRDDYGIDESDDEEEEQYGTCIKCGVEGKFIGKQDDEWTCIECLGY